MNDREKALCAQADIEKVMREYGLPFVFIVLMPDEQGLSRSSIGMKGSNFEGNRATATVAFIDYMAKMSEDGALPNGE